MGVRGQASGPLQIDLCVTGFFFFFEGKNKEAEVNYPLVTFINHWVSLVYNSLARWPVAQGSVSSSCSGETTRVCTLTMMSIIAVLVQKRCIDSSNFSHLTLVD